MGRATLLVLIITGFTSCVLTESDLLHSFYEEHVVSDLIPEAPDDLLTVTFSDDVQVLEGNQLSLTEVLVQPSVEWVADDAGSLYALLCLDPDVPFRGAANSLTFLHWMVLNIPSNNLKNGDTAAIYLPPTPPPASGMHRYVFLLYKQPQLIDFDFLFKETVDRLNFSLTKFVEKYKLGTPVAGNFFQCGTAVDISEVI